MKPLPIPATTPGTQGDYAMVAVLLGWGLRRAETAGLAAEDLQQREEHWVIADLVSKGGHVRTVPVPSWVKAAMDDWLTAAGVAHTRLLARMNVPSVAPQ